MDPKAETPQPGAQTPSRKRISRRTSIIGSVIAVVALAGIGWLAWHLTHPSADAAAGGFAGGRRGAPATTVGVASAERAFPVVRALVVPDPGKA